MSKKKFDWKLIPKWIFLFLKLLIKRIFLTIFWIFYIAAFIGICISFGFWQASPLIVLVIAFYGIKWFRVKTKEEKKRSAAAKNPPPVYYLED